MKMEKVVSVRQCTACGAHDPLVTRHCAVLPLTGEWPHGAMGVRRKGGLPGPHTLKLSLNPHTVQRSPQNHVFIKDAGDRWEWRSTRNSSQVPHPESLAAQTLTMFPDPWILYLWLVPGTLSLAGGFPYRLTVSQNAQHDCVSQKLSANVSHKS
jgi:hypothetical protein